MQTAPDRRRSGAPRRATRDQRVLFCVQNLPVPHDPRVWRESRDLAAAGYEVVVVCPRLPSLSSREVLEGVDIIRYPPAPDLPGVLGQATETLWALLWTTFWAARLRLRGRIDVLHAANPPDTYFLVALLFRPFGTRFVFDQHDACPELLRVKLGDRPAFAWLLRLLERASYRAAHLVVAPNGSYRRLAIERGGKDPDDVIVVRSGPDAVVGAVDVAPGGHPIVTFAGAMDTQDGVELLVDAAAEVLHRSPGRFRLQLIGAGDGVAGLRARAEELGIAADITWTGWLTGSEFRARLAEATVAVSPDRDNPFTRVSTMTKVTDYLGMGLACVVADLPENRATAGDAAHYFVPGDASDLAAVLEALLDDAAGLDELRRRAVVRAEELLWRHSAEALLTAYQQRLP